MWFKPAIGWGCLTAEAALFRGARKGQENVFWLTLGDYIIK